MPIEHLPQASKRGNRLAARARILYMVIPTLTVVLLVLICGLILGVIADESARRLARQYSIEAAANFLSSTNQHFVLMNQISRSTTISRWLAHEHDMDIKARAFEEIMGFASFAPHFYLMFTAYQTLQGYDFDINLTLEEFQPWGRLAGGAVSQWFFNTRDAEKPFILNVQRTRPDAYGHWDLYLWSNHRMYYAGHFAGVVTVGSPFEHVFDATFGGFNLEHKRGYIIDRNAAVRIDSALLLEVTYQGLPTFPALPEAYDNPALVSHIACHMRTLAGGIFLPGVGPCAAIRLYRGAFRYGSIAPIIGTDWSVVVLSNYMDAFAGTDLMPLLISAFAVLILSVIIGNILVRRTALVPLFKLTQSAAAAASISITERAELFGVDREDEIGELSRTIQFMRDNLRSSNAELEETSELNQILIDAAPYVIGLWDDKGNLTSGSQQAIALFGVSDPKMIVDDLYSYSPEFQPCGTPTPVKAAMYAEKAYNEGYARFEWQHKKINGELIPTECIYKTFKHKGKKRLLSYTIDLREIKAAEARQREAFEMVNLLLDASPMFIEVWDDELNLTACNNRVMNVFGLSSKEEFIVRYESFSPEYQPCGTPSKEKHAALLKQALLQDSGTLVDEWMHLAANGEELPVEVTYTRLSHQDKHIVVVYNRDLREIKKAKAEMQRIEVAEENSRAKSRFLAKMSHEIRTPISAVLGISEIQLNNTALPLETEEAFAKIYSSAHTLLSIVNDILDLSKVEAGKMEIVNDKYELASTLSDIVQLNLAYLGSKPLAFNVDVDENIPAFMIGDELRIKQTLNNMLSNAFKYTDEGTVNLKVSVKNKVEDNVDMVVVIQDTGRGMSKEQLNALFDEYSRFHDKEHRFETGTGLGMSITYALLRLMNATIDVDSEVGRGTTVTLVIPQKIGSKEELGPATVRNLKNFNTESLSVVKRLSFTPIPMPYGRILVVDDVDANIYVARGLLSMYQLQVEACSSAAAAIEKIREGEVYDIIFMDQMMPEMNGMEATAIIRQMNYTHPIVALTADALVGQAEKFLQNGFDGFLSKPIQTVHLNALLHKFVKDAHPEAATELPPSKTNQTVNEYFDNFMETSGINDKIRRDLMRNRKNIMREVDDALAANDLKTAHRLIHTLKGLVGTIGEKNLFDLAEKTEMAFRNDIIPTDLLEALDREVERMFVRIKEHLNEPEEQEAAKAVLNNDKTKEVFDKLAQLLKENSFDALELCGELAKIPQTNDLVNQIEAVDFTLALKTLIDLRETLKV